MSIVAATDLSQTSRTAVRYASSLAETLGESLVIVNVLEVWGARSRIKESFDETKLQPSQDAIDELNAFVTETLGADHGARTEVLIGHPPVEQILAQAATERASVIVAGTSGHARLAEAFFGSTISALVRQSEIPVLAVPPGANAARFGAILAPVDFSSCSDQSLSLAARLAAGFDAKLFVLHAAPFNVPTAVAAVAFVPQSASEVQAASRTRVQSMLVEHKLEGRAEILIELGAPHAAIEAVVEQKRIDLVVMGTHSRTGVMKLFLGSTAERVLRSRTCPVLVLREQTEGSV